MHWTQLIVLDKTEHSIHQQKGMCYQHTQQDQYPKHEATKHGGTAYNPSTWKTDTRIQIQSQPGLKNTNTNTPVSKGELTLGHCTAKAVGKRNLTDSNKTRALVALCRVEKAYGRYKTSGGSRSLHTYGAYADRHQSHLMGLFKISTF